MPGKILGREGPSGCDLIATLLLFVDVATVNPGLDTDDAEGRLGLGKTIVDVGAQRMQRQTALKVPLRPGDLVSV